MNKIALFLVALLAIGCHARLPPKESRTSSDNSKEVTSNSEQSPSSPKNPASFYSSEFDSEGYNPSFYMNRQAEINKIFQDTLNMFDFIRSNFGSWHSRTHSHPLIPPSTSGLLGSSEEDSSENPFAFFNTPITIRRPSFSFFDRRPLLNPFVQRPLIPLEPISDETVPEDYEKVNSTRFFIGGQEICQSVFQKVTTKEFGMFSSRIVIAQPCNQTKTVDHESPITEQPEVDKKETDRRFVKPEVEREGENKPTVLESSPTNNSTSVKINGTESENSTSTVSNAESTDTKPNETTKPEKSNEIGDKVVEPVANEPSITVNDK